MRQPSFYGLPSVSAKTLELNTVYSKHELRLPAPSATAKKLAIVGGGSSAQDCLAELVAWNGEVWGINGTASWLIGQGIDATLFTVSPCIYPPEYLDGITRAILGYQCDPWLFDALKAAKVFAFDSDGNGPTSICAGLPLALAMGFEQVSIFGCEGCYGATTHTYQDTPSPADMIVAIGGTAYRTNIGYFMQTKLLAELVREAPNFVVDRSGGMLAALIADPEGWDAITLPSEMKDAA